MEPVSTAVGAVLGAAERAGLVQNLLGPVSKAIGENWAEGYRQRNVARLVRKSARRAGSRLEQPGSVHPRVAHRILEEGSYVEDDVMLEYLSGILAAARTPDGRDDRAAYYANLVASLSADQIRLHHAVYSAAASAQLIPGQAYGAAGVDFDHCVYATVEDGVQVLDDLENVDSSDRILETLTTLRREGLLTTWAQGAADTFDLPGLRPRGDDPGSDDGDQILFVAYPSALGCLLYLWAYGVRTSDVGRFTELHPDAFEPPGPTFANAYLAPFTNPEGWRGPRAGLH